MSGYALMAEGDPCESISILTKFAHIETWFFDHKRQGEAVFDAFTNLCASMFVEVWL